ncbi:hypothetical protein E5D57_010959 [Metarhizium anisopliae]|nr:hypothetical protein E5D57_010959 [Metarhizium anisopliae]
MTNATSDYHGVLDLEPEQFLKQVPSSPLRNWLLTFNILVFFPLELNGLEGASFVAPAALVSRLSTSFEGLVKDDKTSIGTLVLRGVDSDIFWRFFQFVYCGAYKSFGPSGKVNDSETVTASMVDEVIDRANEAEVGNCGLFGRREPKDAQIGTGLFGRREPNDAQIGTGGLFGRCEPNDAQIGTGLFGQRGPNKAREGLNPYGEREANNYKLPYSLAHYKAKADEYYSSFGVPSKRKLDADNDDGNLKSPSHMKLHLISSFMKQYNIDVLPARFQSVAHCEQFTFANGFLGHARIWYFAYEHSITRLMDHACSQLASELVHWVISPSDFVADFGVLVRYVYIDCTAENPALQQLVARFAVCLVEDVLRLEGWAELLKQMPSFAVDLIAQMGSRYH